MRKFDLRVDITGSTEIPGPMEIAATVYLPDPARLGPRPIGFFAAAGGGYSRHYFDMSFPGHEGYSEVAQHVEAGFIFIAYDPIGTGDSTLPDPEQLPIETICKANDAMVRAVSEKLRKGTLHPDFPAVPNVFRIGAGQSQGGCLTIVTQGRHKSFDAIAVLGYSGLHTVPPLRDPVAREGLIASMGKLNRQTPLKSLSIKGMASSHTKDDMHYPHHWEDVPPDIVKADTSNGYPFERRADWPPFWRSAALPSCALIMMSPGAVKDEAAAIEVPVLTAMGERDVCPDPWAEPSAYPRAKDVSLFVVPRMAHMHNFASTRKLLWDRLEGWARMVAAG